MKRIIISILILLITTIGYGAWESEPLTGTSDTISSVDDNVNTLSQGIANAIQPIKGLVVKNNATNPTYQLDIDADTIGTDTYVNTSVNLTIDINNGQLDTGSEASSTLYAVWYAYNPTADADTGLFSTSFTSPTLPSGYDYKKLIGMVFNDSGGDFLPFDQMGSIYNYRAAQKVLTNGSAASWTAIDCSNYVDSNLVTFVRVDVDAVNNTDSNDLAYFKSNLPSSGKIVAHCKSTTSRNSVGEFLISTRGQTNIDYKTENGYIDIDVYVHGAVLNIK